jgi:hypothetical protein
MKNITFTNTKNTSDLHNPIPAKNNIPAWYKELDSYIGKVKRPDGEGGTTSSAKRCMPLFDSITAGYLILSPADIFVSQRDGQPWFEWANFDLIEFHPVEQAPNHPNNTGHLAYPKWNNPWSVKTPKGYSCLFTAPKHRDNVFTILDGIVDTDIYSLPVNFPFVLNDISFEGLIPAGTPIAQVIPFKRDSFQMNFGTESSYKELEMLSLRLSTRFFDRYKNLFWQKKEYK